MKKLERIMENILGDQLSGSVVLLNKLIDSLKDWSDKSEELRSTDPQEFLEMTTHLQNQLSDFTVMSHFLNEVNAKIREGEDLMDLSQWCQHYQYEWSDVADRMAQNFLETIEMDKGTVLLHSNSGTIHSIFNQLKDKELEIDIIQTESRPNNEGVIQAETLSSLGYNVKLIPDAASHQIMEEVDMVLLGADSIYQDYFVNKLGSYPIVSAAREYQIPVYVIADSRKLWKSIPGTASRRWSGPKLQDPKELYDGGDSNIKAVNHYFESVPNRYVKAFLTENQVYRPGEFWEL